jgi:hypothetical protein
MTKKRVAAAPPKDALPKGESNRYLAKFKSSLCKRWSSTRMETLYEIFDLAAFLWALERDDEALAVAGSVAADIPAPPPLPGGGCNYDVWCPATLSHALVVHLAPRTWRDRAEASRAALQGDCGIARDNSAYIADGLAEARQDAAAPAGQKSTKWECQALARHLGTLVLYSELAKAGDRVFKRHAKEAAVLIPRILSKLGTTLQAAK